MNVCKINLFRKTGVNLNTAGVGPVDISSIVLNAEIVFEVSPFCEFVVIIGQQKGKPYLFQGTANFVVECLYDALSDAPFYLSSYRPAAQTPFLES